MMIGRPRAFCRREGGNVAIPFAIALILVLGVSALVIDLGHYYNVKQEMQNACDAGACAGATALFLNADGTTRADPDWANGLTAATNAVQQCTIDNVLLSDFSSANVEEGYWSCAWSNGIPTTSPANGHLLGHTSPGAYSPPLSPPYQYPAVKVSLTKAAGGTGTSAPIIPYLASVLGINTMEVRSSAVAARYYPSTINNAFPFAIPSDYFGRDAYGTLVPNNLVPGYSGTNLWTATTVGTNTTYSVNVSNTPSASEPGEWTSFGNPRASADEIKGLILGANTTLTIGNEVYLASGVQSADYNAVQDNCLGHTYMAAVVDMSTFDSKTNKVGVVGFVSLKITACTGSGSGAYVTCQWVPGYVNPKASGAGPPYGAPLPAKLVQ